MVTVIIKQSMTKRQLFIWFLRVLKGLIVIALLFDIAAYVLIVVGAIMGESLDLDDRVFVILASLGYMMVCVCLLIGEFGPEWFITNMRVFHYWGFRGCALAWQGIQTIYSVKQLAASLAGAMNDRVDITKLLGEICGYILIGIGLLYLFMSAICLRDVLKLDLPYEWRGDEPILEGGQASLLVPMAEVPPLTTGQNKISLNEREVKDDI